MRGLFAVLVAGAIGDPSQFEMDSSGAQAREAEWGLRGRSETQSAEGEAGVPRDGVGGRAVGRVGAEQGGAGVLSVDGLRGAGEAVRLPEPGGGESAVPDLAAAAVPAAAEAGAADGLAVLAVEEQEWARAAAVTRRQPVLLPELSDPHEQAPAGVPELAEPDRRGGGLNAM